MKKIHVEVSPWDHGDSYIIAIRPEAEKSWKAIPVGCELGRQKADLICDWLKSNMNTLQKIILQTEADPAIPDQPTTPRGQKWRVTDADS